jgi:hypothetical protein
MTKLQRKLLNGGLVVALCAYGVAVLVLIVETTGGW